MNIQIKLIKHDDNGYETVTVYEKKDLQPTDLWIDLIKSIDVNNNWQEYYYLPLDEENIEERVVDYDDFYGPVKFDVLTRSFTIEQLLSLYSKNGFSVTIKGSMYGKGGGGNYIITILQLLKTISTMINHIPLNHPVEMFITKKLYDNFNRDNKMLKYFTDENIDSNKLIDYLYSKEKWSMKALKVSFPYYQEEVLIEVMELLMFEYDYNKSIFNRKNEFLNLSEFMKDMNPRDQFRILEEYLKCRQMNKEA